MGIGFTPDQRYRRHQYQFLHHLTRKTIQFAVQGNRGRLIMGAQQPMYAEGYTFFPMTRKNLFYGIQVHDIIFNQNTSCRLHYPERMPHMIIFDTGSNMMDLPSPLFHLFQKLSLDIRGDITFVVKTIDNTFYQITIDPTAYLWNKNDTTSSIVGKSPSGGMDCVIWGSLFMNNFEFWFDVDQETVGIRKLTEGKT